MPSSPTYLLPALLLNPVLVLHSLNTLFSHSFPPPPTPSTSSNAWLEKLGPLPGSTPYFDVHDSEGLCWTYTLIMVVAQVLAFSRIQGSRLKRKTRLRRGGKEIKHSRWSEPDEVKGDVKRKENEDMEEERRRKGFNGDVDSVDAAPYNPRSEREIRSISSNRKGNVKKVELNGTIHQGIRPGRQQEDEEDMEEDNDSVESETSEEVMII